MRDIRVSIGPIVQIYNQTARNALQQYWPDGLIGVVAQSGNDYTAFSPVGLGDRVLKTVGPISDFAAARTVVLVGSRPAFASFATGGPVVSLDDGPLNLAMVVHFERWPKGGMAHFYSSLGIAKSDNGGQSWNCLSADMIVPNLPFDPDATESGQEIGGGAVVPVGGYYYIYFREHVKRDTGHMSVARVPIDDFNAAVLAWRVPTAEKWQGGATWSGSNPGAPLSTLSDGRNSVNLWVDVWKDDVQNVFLLVSTCNITRNDAFVNLYLSEDGINWIGPTRLTNETSPRGSEGVVYCSLVPSNLTGVRTGNGPWTIVYTFGQRWTAAAIRSRTLTLTGEPRGVAGG